MLKSDMAENNVIIYTDNDGRTRIDVRLEEGTCRNFRQVRLEGKRQVSRELPFYNLDMIIALGYRVRSIIATRFRQCIP